MENKTFVPDLGVSSVFDSAWGLTKKHFLPIFLLMLVGGMLYNLPSSYFYSSYYAELLSGNYLTEEEWIAKQIDAAPVSLLKNYAVMLLLAIVCGLIRMYIDLVRNRVLLSAKEKNSVDMTAIIKGGFSGYWFFLICTLLSGIIIGIGYVFCILPGIFLQVRLMFVPIIAANKPELTLSEVFSRSWNMTEGRFLDLLLFGIIVVLLNIVGFICCCIGLYVTSIISEFMYVELYYRLSNDGNPASPAEDVTFDGRDADGYIRSI